MYLKSLRLTHFKNYEGQAFAFSPRLNCFVGKNGMGKTNALDAIHYLCMTKSGITSGSDRLLVQHEADFFRLEGAFEADQRTTQIVVKYLAGKSKVVERNGTPYARLSAHIGAFPVVMIAPNDTQLALEGSEERRRFWDATISQVDGRYLDEAMRYNKLLSQRNAYLKSTNRPQEALLSIYDEQMAPLAAYLHEQRKAHTALLRPILEEAYRRISGGQESVSIAYRSKLDEQDFQSLMLDNREKDAVLQRTTQGIHRDDWSFKISGHLVKKYASQGQLKSYVLALKIAQYDLLRQERQVSPIVLLDDVFDKLDHDRVRDLVKLLIEEDFGQIFITDTDAARTERIIKEFAVPYRRFDVVHGTVQPQPDTLSS